MSGHDKVTKKGKNIEASIDKLQDRKDTERILTSDQTEYSKESIAFIEHSRKTFSDFYRKQEIDKALDSKDENRFYALVAEDWKETLGLKGII